VWDVSYSKRNRKTRRFIGSVFGRPTTLNKPPGMIRNGSREPSVEAILDWVKVEKGDWRFELFAETTDHAETRERGWAARRKLIRLAGDFHSSPAPSDR
jgi:hypothetical protein